jgi:hypothetical protein
MKVKVSFVIALLTLVFSGATIYIGSVYAHADQVVMNGSERIDFTNTLYVRAEDGEINEEMNVLYTITQTWSDGTSPLVIDLPKNNQGVWTNYGIVSSQVIDAETLTEIEVETKVIKELDTFHIVIEPVNSSSEKAVYLYELELQVTVDPEKKYDLVLVNNWQYEVGILRIEANEKSICESQLCNASSRISIPLHSDKASPSSYSSWFITFLPFMLIVVFGLLVCASIWVYFNPKIKKSTQKSTIQPTTNPFESYWILYKEVPSLTNVLLGYLWYLEELNFVLIDTTHQKISLKILKSLPAVLPIEWNQLIKRMEKSNYKATIKFMEIHQFSYTAQLSEWLKLKSKTFFVPHRFPLGKLVTWGIIPLLLLSGCYVIISILFAMTGYGTSFLSVVFCLVVMLYIVYAVYLQMRWRVLTKGLTYRQDIKKYHHYLSILPSQKPDTRDPKIATQNALSHAAYATIFGLQKEYAHYLQHYFPEDETAIKIVQTYSITNVT